MKSFRFIKCGVILSYRALKLCFYLFGILFTSKCHNYLLPNKKKTLKIVGQSEILQLFVFGGLLGQEYVPLQKISK